MKPRIVNVAAAKARLSELLEEVASGVDIVIARAGKPKVRLVPFSASEKTRRKPGKKVGGFRVSKGFDAPLTAKELALFEGDDE